MNESISASFTSSYNTLRFNAHIFRHEYYVLDHTIILIGIYPNEGF